MRKARFAAARTAPQCQRHQKLAIGPADIAAAVLWVLIGPWAGARVLARLH